MNIASRLLVVALGAALLPASAGLADEIPQAADAPRPLGLEESRARFRLPEGFRIEIVASEPQVTEPTGLCFDARGRIYVCELHGYNLDGYYDILELNKSGVLDRAVRRIPATKEAERRAARETFGRVRLLETDEGGRVVRSTVIADRLPPCYGVVPALDGVIVLCAPEIVFLADRDGDGHAEVRETLFAGFGVGEIWTNISNPRWGADNWIYAAGGQSSGGVIRGPRLAGEVTLGKSGFRFKPDGSRFEPVSGGTSGFGLAIDDWGDRFLCTNQQHALHVAPLPYESLARNPHSAALDPVVNISTYGHPAPVFPTSRPDPWRLKRGEEAQWVKFYGAAETVAGQMTSACSPTLYLADQFPGSHRGNLFACEPAQNLVHRTVLTPKGAGFEAGRGDEGVEFLTSSDPWFRPVGLAVGPEGALYVVDMYREIIEDYSAIPRYLQQQYVESLRNGRDHGRVWRIFHGERPPIANANLSEADVDGLLGELGHANSWRRLTAQRLLVERAEKGAVPALEEMTRIGKTPQARSHALYTLDGLGGLTPDVVERALVDDHYGVRLQALRLAQRWLNQRPSLLARVLEKVDDPHPKVRLQLASTLGEVRGLDALPTLARLLESDGQDRWMQSAVFGAVPDRSASLAILLAGRGVEGGRSSLRPLAAITGSRRDDGELVGLLRWLAGLPLEGNSTTRGLLLAGLRDGLARDPSSKLPSAAAREPLERLLETTRGPDRKQVVQVAGLVRLADSPAFRAVLEAAVVTALDESKPVAERVESLDSLAGTPTGTLVPLRGLMAAREPLDLQLAVIPLLADGEGPEGLAALLEGWPGYSPRVQSAILEVACARRDRLPIVLDAVENKVIDPSSLPTSRQARLREDRDPEIRRRARLLLAARATGEDRRRVIEPYQAALGSPREPARGRVIFEAQCAKCHQLDGVGFAVGPDLAAIRNRPDESILVEMLDPSGTIVAGYRAYTVNTRSGRVVSGVLASETATSVTLRRAEGVEETILRKDIEEILGSATSLMPEGLEKEISPRDMADLIGYLREALRGAGRAVSLFAGDPAFAAVLGEGDGQATVSPEESTAGRPSLRVSPPQRSCARIPGWDFPIAEKPGPGEYRFLRFAWKAPGATGVMLELADNGAWPGADRARGRFYSGTNTTGWEATRVDERVPGDWVVVTRDLWKEFGPMRLSGLAPTAMGGDAYFARIELLASPD